MRLGALNHSGNDSASAEGGRNPWPGRTQNALSHSYPIALMLFARVLRSTNFRKHNDGLTYVLALSQDITTRQQTKQAIKV